MSETGHRRNGKGVWGMEDQGERANKSQMPRVSRWSEKNSLPLRLSGVHTLIHLENAKLNIGFSCDELSATFTRLVIKAHTHILTKIYNHNFKPSFIFFNLLMNIFSPNHFFTQHNINYSSHSHIYN